MFEKDKKYIILLIPIVLIQILTAPIFLIGILNIISNNVIDAANYSNTLMVPIIYILLTLLISSFLYLKNLRIISITLMLTSIPISIIQFKIILPYLWL